MKVTVDLPDEFIIQTLRDAANTLVDLINDQRQEPGETAAVNLIDHFVDLAAMNTVIEYFGGERVIPILTKKKGKS